ncbi:Short-chain dehydrogenase/reductase SDR [Candidatus Omnitrophus magneticus]|uniref:Short-chain dehydrogenase/reductase SDR n=1 Tax=Candidatus Omnitrophus magneticus TaxID=1609969 RepID=A0A0F0CQD5_9BACT|nr:Short-chain dehydrogenase/reductase SDR [Candidatus Omnitrophus magneticus]
MADRQKTMIFGRNKVKNVFVTNGILQDVDPSKWKEHRFGLPVDRWSSLKDKSFWITGAGTGYGSAISTALAAAGATVFLTGRRVSKLRETLQKMSDLNIYTDKCVLLEADITNYKDILSASEKIKGMCSSLYGLVNNAGVPPLASSYPFQDGTIEYWEQTIKTNLTAPWLITREILPHMLLGKSVRVIFISSEAGWAFTSGVGIYNVSKAGLNNLSASMAEEYTQHFKDIDIQMNTLDPGEARTEMNTHSRTSPYSVVSMTLTLLSCRENGPNGKFFRRDGTHLAFSYSSPYDKSLL